MDVRCYDCGATYDAEGDAGPGDGSAGFPARKRCDCGEPLWFDIDASGFDWDALDDRQGVWRYADLLPVDPPGRDNPEANRGPPADGLGAGAGDTRLVRAGRLDEMAGCRVWVKDESGNPTGTFKDRGSAVGVAAAAARGVDRVGTVSHGNMAASVSATAASHGLDCVVLVPADIPEARLGRIAQYGPRIVAVDGDYGQLYYDSLALDAPVAFVNSDTPLRVAGQKTTALEICEAFAPAAPDAVVLPVSSGGHASAAWKGLRELRAAGLLDELPRLYLVQAAACDPIAAAYRAGDERVRSVEGGETIAFSIANSDPPSGTRALAAARDTGGRVVAVPDDEIRAAQDALARHAGLAVEPASATTLAGLKRLTESGAIGPDEDAVAVATGTGFGTADGSGAVDATVTLGDLPAAVAGGG